MTAGIELYDMEGKLVLSNHSPMLIRDSLKKVPLSSITVPRFHVPNPYLTNAKTKAITGYNGSNLEFHAIDSWEITDHGVIYLYQPKDQCSIAFTTGRFPTADAGQQGVMGVTNVNNTGYVLPTRITHGLSPTSGIIEVFDESGNMTWNFQTLLECPVVVDVIRVPLNYPIPFNQWDLRWVTPANMNPDNIFFVSPNENTWGYTEESWQCSWMNFTRDGRDYWYVPGSTEPPQAYPSRPDLGRTKVAQVFNREILIYVLHAVNAT